MFRSNGGYGQIAKAIQTFPCRYPNASFAVFENSGNTVTGETIRLSKHISSPSVGVQKALAPSSNPQRAIAIVEEVSHFHFPHRTGELKPLHLPIHDALNPLAPSKQ